MTLNRDSLIAIALLLICGGLMVASFDIREPDYGQLSPAAWPRAIVAIIAVLSGLYLVQSLRQGPDVPDPDAPRGAAALLSHWRNVVWVFVLFLAYLLAIPQVGMLVGGVIFVFALLTAIGGFARTPLHIVIAFVTIGGVWLLFTQGLGVILPRGALTGF
ncbi:MAG: tripartite tricarboxylate transporter TctB family protein [Pseudomonadota bacterium]